MGIDVAVAPRAIFLKKTPRAAGITAISARVFPSTSLLVTYASTPSTGTLSSSASSTSVGTLPAFTTDSRPLATAASLARSPMIFTNASRVPATATTSFSRSTVSAVASSMTPLRRRRRTKTRAFGTRASASTARRPTTLPLDCTRNARISAVPSRACSPELLRASPFFLLVLLAGFGQIHPDQSRTEHRNYDRRSNRSKHVGHCISNGHRVEQSLCFVRGQAEAVDGVRGEAHGGRNRL